MKVPSRAAQFLLAALLVLGPASSCVSPSEDVSTSDALGELEGRGEILRSWLASMGVAASPIFGLAAAGTLGYYQLPPEQRSSATFFYRPGFWGTLWLIAGLILFKDVILTFFGALKTPLDAVALLVQNAGSLVGAAYVLTLVGEGISGSDLMALVGNVAVGTVTLLVYFSVFVTFNTFEVLIVLNPVPLVDTALTAVRSAVVTLFFAATYFHPAVGLLATSPVILLSLWMTGKAVRFTTLGLTFASDLFFRRWRAMDPQPGDPVLAFATAAFTGSRSNLKGLLVRQPDGALEFRYRRFQVGPVCTLVVPGSDLARLQLGKATLAPVVTGPGAERSTLSTLFRIPPRYRGHEHAIASHLGISRVADISLGRGIRSLLNGSMGMSSRQAAQ